MKVVSRGFLSLAIVVCATLLQGSALTAAEPKPIVGPRWEYRVLTKEQVLELGKKDLVAGLNRLGEEGWDLVAVEPAHYFKRLKEQGIRQAEDVKRRIALLKEDLEMWKDRVTWCERMVRKGYMTETQLQAERAHLIAAELALQMTEKESKVVLPPPKPEK
jgi:hypothetical protein